MPKTRWSSAREEEATRGLVQVTVVGRTGRCFSIHTRPVSWLGRYYLAHIRAQREPVVSPAGAGNEYR